MDRKVLIATVSAKPQVKLISWPSSQVLMGNDRFDDVGAGDTNGFYDFLRLPDHRIVGARFTPFVEFSRICDSAIPGPGLRITGKPPHASLELIWKEEGHYDPSLSADQFFDDNYVLRSGSHRYAITFGFSHLSQNETKELLSSLEILSK